MPARRADLEWKVIYVGSAESSQYDQVLDAIFVGPVPIGVNRFVFQVRDAKRCNSACLQLPSPKLTISGDVLRTAVKDAQCDAPDISKIPPQDVLGVTAVMITCSYMNVEFVRIGYYVNVDYVDEQMKENPPATVAAEHLGRKYVGAPFASSSEDERPARVGLTRDRPDHHRPMLVPCGSILADRPRVTRFPIDWENPQNDPQRRQFELENAMASHSDDGAIVSTNDEDDEEDEDDEDDVDGENVDPNMDVEENAEGMAVENAVSV